MKLLYRGIPYEINNQPVQSPLATETSEPTTQPKVQLRYRGSIYTYQTPSQPQLVAEADFPNVRIIDLMYRGQTYQRKSLVPAQQADLQDWHWQFGLQA